jgi:sortase A
MANRNLILISISIVVTIVAIAGLLTFQTFHHKNSDQISVLGVSNNVVIKLPTRLQIPSINLDANIEQVGIAQDSTMDVPQNIYDVGWYKLGPIPGATGSAVITGHLDGKSGEKGVFSELDKLKSGDKIKVRDNLGVESIFIVTGSKNYPPGFADEVFYSQDGKSHLNLITCNGTWDVGKNSYSQRLVVFADLVSP